MNSASFVSSAKKIVLGVGAVLAMAATVQQRVGFMCIATAVKNECSYRMHNQGKKYLRDARKQKEILNNRKAKMYYEAAVGEFEAALAKNQDWLHVKKSRTYAFLIESYLGAERTDDALEEANKVAGKKDSLERYIPKDEFLSHQVLVARLRSLSNSSQEPSTKRKLKDSIDELERTHILMLANAQKSMVKYSLLSGFIAIICVTLLGRSLLHLTRTKVLIARIGDTPVIREKLSEYFRTIQAKKESAEITEAEEKELNELSASINSCLMKLEKYENAVERLRNPSANRAMVDKHMKENRKKLKEQRRKRK